MNMPTLFISHGAPTMALQPGAAGEALRRLGARLPKPTGILMVSAHWETHAPSVSSATQPETIHDFFGFPPPLYELRYPAPGAPDLARRAAQLLNQAGIAATLDAQRGLDHGAWVPLRYLRPNADVPVTQLSIQPQLSPLHHYRVGEALRPLTAEGVLIVGSGSLTHNLGEFRLRGEDVPSYVRGFQEWVRKALEDGDCSALMDYRKLAPDAVRAHPTDEHFLPLFVALGAQGGGTVRRYTDEVTFGVIAMDGYVFGMEQETVVA